MIKLIKISFCVQNIYVCLLMMRMIPCIAFQTNNQLEKARRWAGASTYLEERRESVL